MDVMKKVPVREQAPDVRNKNFDEVCLGYNKEEAMEEATRCLNCKNARCVQGCPVSIDIPAFVHQVKEGNIEEAYKIIGKSSALPAVCGRVCPQETQCEGQCIRGIKGESVSIGKLERFVADWARENNVEPEKPTEKKGKKVAVIGSGPSGLTCAGDLAKMGYEVTIFEALHEAGGVLVYGIPEFRLPKSTVVAHEVENVKKLGVKIETNVVIGKRGKKFPLVYLDDTKELIRKYLEWRGEDNIDSLWIKGSGENKEPISDPNVLYGRIVSISKILSEVRGEQCNIFTHTMRHSRLECLAQGTDERLLDENGQPKKYPLEQIQVFAHHSDVSTTQSYLKDHSEDTINSMFGIA